jgi:hypothetical protein
LILIVIRGHAPPIALLLHANFPGDCDSLFFTMSHFDFAGEFRREGAKNNADNARRGAIDIPMICANRASTTPADPACP